MRILLVFTVLFLVACSSSGVVKGVRKADMKRDIEMVTTKGTIILRLSDATPLHRDNFIRLTRSGFYNGVSFHRVIKSFMIQSGDPNSRIADSAASVGSGGPGYTVPAEIVPSLFHHKGALAAARMGDNVNPQRASSGSQFYIVQGKVFSLPGLDSLEQTRLRGYTIPEEHKAVYTSVGGAPHLDQQYTVFGKVVNGWEVIDSVAAVATGNRDRPVEDVRIITMKMIKRKKVSD